MGINLQDVTDIPYVKKCNEDSIMISVAIITIVGDISNGYHYEEGEDTNPLNLIA
jgi:hypothetical protein